MATKFASAHSFFTTPASRLHITQRPVDYTATPQALTPEQLRDVALHTVAIWLEIHDALHAGVKEFDEAAQRSGLSRSGVGSEGVQDEPLCTVWGAVKFKSLEFTLTVHSDTLPQDALQAAIGHLLTIRALREEFPAEQAEAPAPAPAPAVVPKSKQAPSSAPTEKHEAAVVTHFESFDGKAKDEHVAAGVISFDVYKIEMQYTPKGQRFWGFYGLWNGRPSQYPCAGVRVYEDGKFLPEGVLSLLQDAGAEAEGKWRVTARVVRKGENTYYNVTAIDELEASQGAPEYEADEADIPF